MNLDQIQRGAFDVVEAVRLLAGKVDALEGALQASGPGPNMDAGGQGATLRADDLVQPGETVLIVREGLRGLLNDRVAEVLDRAGFATVASIAGATDEALRAVNGIGPVTLREIRQVIPAVSS